MPDASHDKLSYSRQALEKVRARYDRLSREQLLELVCDLTQTYVVEQTIPFDIPIPEHEGDAERVPQRSASPARPERRDSLPEPLPDDLGQPDRDDRVPARTVAHERFAQLVVALKKRADLPQLELFLIEEGRVVLRVDNQKVTFGERTTVEFVPSQGRPRRPSGERAAAEAPPPAGAPTSLPAPTPAPSVVETPPGARPGLPGGDGRTRQGSSAGPFGAPPAPGAERGEQRQGGQRPGGTGVPTPATRPPTAGAPPAPAADKPKTRAEGDLTDVEHIVERFKRLDLD